MAKYFCCSYLTDEGPAAWETLDLWVTENFGFMDKRAIG